MIDLRICGRREKLFGAACSPAASFLGFVGEFRKAPHYFQSLSEIVEYQDLTLEGRPRDIRIINTISCR